MDEWMNKELVNENIRLNERKKERKISLVQPFLSSQSALEVHGPALAKQKTINTVIFL